MDRLPSGSSLVAKKAAKTVAQTSANPSEKAVVARLTSVNHQYGTRHALRDMSLDLPAGCMVGLIGPDGVGKSTLLGLVAGARQLQQGQLEVLGGDMADSHFRSQVAPCIAYMPQGLGGNLYHTLTVDENIDFFADLFGLRGKARGEQIDRLLDATGLLEFRDRPAGKLSGGMKQKLGLCCALIHNPDLLILDEPTTGVDPLSRKRFWDLIDTIRSQQAGMSVLVATAYMEEAERYDWLVAMDDGAILATGSPQELKQQTKTDNLDDAFIALLPKERQETGGDAATTASASAATDNADVPAIEAHNLTLRFGDFTAVKDVSFTIPKGEIFGFLGSNGCGKTTTMKMLTGLLTPSEGEVLLFGATLDARDLKTRQRVGYMSQSFSLYNELTVRQNLELHAKLFHLPAERIQPRMDELTQEFSLEDVMDRFAGDLPLGVRQRLSLAVAVVHSPELLILDEPTSGVDPGARNRFWQLLLRLSREDGVTIFISTHFMNEGERCDRISLMHAGEVLACDTPAALAEQAGIDNLEAAFMQTLEAVDKEPVSSNSGNVLGEDASDRPRYRRFSFQRLMAYGRRETRELLRDPIRMAFAFIGSALLMMILGYGITLDVEDLTFAVLDQDQTPQSRDYITAVSGSRYFLEQPPVATMAELEQRMKSGELSLVLAIPPGFGKNLKRGRPTEIAVWVDGAMPFRGETILGYIQGLHFSYLKDLAQRTYGSVPAFSLVTVEARYRYNQDFRSLDAMVPAVIPILLIFIPAILMALGIVREKELGSITNLYVTPVNRLEFLLGKQLPYIGFSMVSYASLVVLAIFLFDVPIKGGVLTLTFGALLFVTATTGLGQVISAFASTQIAALAATAIITILPTVQFSGMTEPVSSLDGAAAVIGQFWPATWFLQISRGVFTKGLTLVDMQHAFLVLAAFIPVLTLMSVLLLRKQGR
ncbi:ribosome-associated ATPase/putative transporter RbbA [Marinobacter sp. M3C]|jgi:ribosome-dependent ATPase|uniref:ribosome-associated ATPase/putative transporter RbbA n=1 Tax=unclassified Marinobacter TaxID=83889 RepID=UPI00200D9BD7|nr:MULTISPECIES: ribosome-associated ATPase/putative transporter RbbA [unclassified Marinobacter]MCL1476653.1 ribosome-associated ATPase/putative transporter RbbA [Marinobacter sp.]MCL1481158.1 ribosome-associated ATPase/putative transporter RbbA [Marinobacter sp.]MCL1485444.1 ribosome-associated ATPase/putative transporter RbbA [Marinobacter sp.]MCL1487976.1 ribosome-associated ATPase/putative transporter RbbA [Marinobacter sp.]UQG56117.1 ribosome-associated ATPase/putative transporter RbbA [